MLISDRIESFVSLGGWISKGLLEIAAGNTNELSAEIEKANATNPWFTKESIIRSLTALDQWLDPKAMNEWAQHYHLSEPVQPKVIAVIMAGNIPLVNFHDFLAVLLTGHKFIGKLSSHDKILLPFLAKKLTEINPKWKDKIHFTEDRLDAFDAVIATGSNNTSRYFHYYFSKYPHIIRKNRNSIGILTGNETKDELIGLFDDLFQYYGMGCRNVSLLLVPNGYHFPTLFDSWQELPKPTEHYKYNNNYDYYRSIYLINSQPFFDTGYVSVLKDDSIASPLSVVHYKEYEDMKEVKEFLGTHKSEIQCIVGSLPTEDIKALPFGSSQAPGLMDYPDNVDIIQFLLAL